MMGLRIVLGIVALLPACLFAATPLTGYDAALLVIRDAPDVLTAEALIEATARQIQAEQTALASIAGSVPNFGPRRPGGQPVLLQKPNPKRAAFVYAWQDYVDQNTGIAQDLAKVFADSQATWPFVTREPEWDPAFDSIVEAFVFSRAKIEEREPQFAARELAPVYQKFLQMAAAGVGQEFELEIPLPQPTYDFDTSSFKFQKPMVRTGVGQTAGVSLMKPLDGVQSQAPANSRDGAIVVPGGIQGLAFYSIYNPDSNWRLPAPKVMKPGAALPRSPSAVWRDNLQNSGPIFVSAFAFDRQLSLSAVPVDVAQAENVVKTMRTSGGAWVARITLSDCRGAIGEGYGYDPQGKGVKFGVISAKIRAIQVMGPGGLSVSIDPGTLPAPIVATPIEPEIALDPVMEQAVDRLAKLSAEQAAVLEACSPGAHAARRTELEQFLAAWPDYAGVGIATFDSEYQEKSPGLLTGYQLACKQASYSSFVTPSYQTSVDAYKQGVIQQGARLGTPQRR